MKNAIRCSSSDHRFPYIEFYPKPGQARCVQIDVDGARIGLRYPVEVGLVSQASEALRRLIPYLQRKEDRSFLKKAQDGKAKWQQLMEEQASVKTMPMKPQVIAHEIGQRLNNDAIFISDSGSITTWYARYLPFRYGQQAALCRAISRRWLVVCLTPSARKSPTPTGRSSHSSATAAFPC